MPLRIFFKEQGDPKRVEGPFNIFGDGRAFPLSESGVGKQKGGGTLSLPESA